MRKSVITTVRVFMAPKALSVCLFEVFVKMVSLLFVLQHLNFSLRLPMPSVSISLEYAHVHLCKNSHFCRRALSQKNVAEAMMQSSASA